MTQRLVAALGRSSRTTRRLTLAALALVVLLVVASVLAPARHPARLAMPPPTGTRTQRAPPAGGSRRISAGGLVAAKRVTARFLAGYLPFLYGRGSARSIEAVTPAVRRQLSRVRGLITPVEGQRHPRVVALTAVAQSPAAALATGLVADGGVTTYALRITLHAGREGWMVSGVDGG